MSRLRTAAVVAAIACLPGAPACAQVPSDLTAKISGLERQISEARAQNEELQRAAGRLQSEIDALEQKPHAERAPLNLAAVKHSNAAVLHKPGEATPLFHAMADDEFEILAFQKEWVQVSVGKHESGWIRRSDLRLLEDDQPTATSRTPGADPEFAVAREAVNVFLGDWAGLRGRRALFLFAMPLGLSEDASSREKKLLYVKELFADRYRSVLHSDRGIQGMVVIFQGGGGGVAAATMTDIRRWVEGEMPEEVFLRRCSLDLPVHASP